MAKPLSTDQAKAWGVRVDPIERLPIYVCAACTTPLEFLPCRHCDGVIRR